MAKAARKSNKKAGAKRSNRKPKRSFKVFIGRVLRQTAKSKLTLSGKAAAVINSFVNHQFDAIASQAAQVARVSGEKTLSSRAIQTAVRLTLPTELAKHAMAEGTKAVARASA